MRSPRGLIFLTVLRNQGRGPLTVSKPGQSRNTLVIGKKVRLGPGPERVPPTFSLSHVKNTPVVLARAGGPPNFNPFEELSARSSSSSILPKLGQVAAEDS